MNELQRLLTSDGAFTPPRRIFKEIPGDLRHARPAGVAHSIAEELWHIVYWQENMLAWARRRPLPYPSSSSEGWVSLDECSDAEWGSLIARFDQALDEASRLAAQPAHALSEQDTSYDEPGAPRVTRLDVLIDMAVHDAYHLGRIVQLRQMLGIWPPPGGGDQW